MNHHKIADAGEILRTVVGSGVHGIAIEGTDDRDEMGVFIEPPEHVMGVGDALNTITYRTQPEGERSGPGDLDLVRYSLRHYVRLVIKGNPNVLLPLFAPQNDVLVSTEYGQELRRARPLFLSQRCIRQTLGYMNAQVARMKNDRKMPNRPELVKRYGFDTKYASHAVRLAIQAYELAETGELSLPMREPYRKLVLEVKIGRYSKDEIVDIVQEYDSLIGKVMIADECPLRATPDYEAINAFVIGLHQMFWRESR